MSLDLMAIARAFDATLDYTTADDGVWLEHDGKRINLGFGASVSDAIAALAGLLKADAASVEDTEPAIGSEA